MDLTALYPVLIILGFILLFIIVVIGAFLIGKQKYNANNGIVNEKKVKEEKVKEEKVKEKKSNSDIKLSEKDAAAIAAFNKSGKEGTDDGNEYERDVSTLKEEAARNKKVIEGPVIIVNDNEQNEQSEPAKKAEVEEIIEWKPPAEENNSAAESNTAESNAAESNTAAIPDKPAGDEWNDEDLELFEARTYAFDEETQSGYMKEREQKKDGADEEAEMAFVHRERREQIHDPADDEGVQVFETFEKDKPAETPSKAAQEEAKRNNSKYAYFDSVMEKEQTEKESTDWQPPQKRDESAPAEGKSESKPKKSMQYIELDLEDK
ncbi:MAG: hypothetical protein FWE54_03715 [Methanimicrococcus sp.]|nr:hypothetical protein [Methanimicrococcus sp.]